MKLKRAFILTNHNQNDNNQLSYFMPQADPFINYLLAFLQKPLFPPIFQMISDDKPISQINEAWLEVYQPLNSSEPDTRQDDKKILRPNREKNLLSIADLFSFKKYLILTGDQGCGKRTFLRTLLIHLLYQNIEERSESEPTKANSFFGENKNPLWTTPHLLPIAFSIRELAHWTYQQKKNSRFIQFLMDILIQKGFSGESNSLVDEVGRKGVILLVDGITLSNTNIQDIKPEFNQIAKFLNENQKCRLLAISGIEKKKWVNEEFSKEYFISSIQNLSPESVQDYLRCLFNFYRKITHFDERELQSSELEISGQLINNESLFKICRNPFYLTLISILSICRVSKEFISEEQIVDAAARWMIEKSLGDFKGIQGELISGKNKLTYALGEWAQKISQNNQIETRSEKSQFVLPLSLKGKIVQDTENLDLYFYYAPIKEYLRAQYLVKTASIEEIVNEILTNPETNEILIKLVIYILANESQQSIIHLTRELLGKKGELSVWASFFAGWVILRFPRLIGEEYVIQTKMQSALLHSLESGRIPNKKKSILGEMIDQAGDIRFSKDHWYLPSDPMYGFIEIPEGPFYMGTREEEIQYLIDEYGIGSDWEGQTLGAMLSQEPNVEKLIEVMGLTKGWEDLDAKVLMRQWYKRETPLHQLWLPKYLIGKYPVTIAQFKAFVQDTGFKPQIPEGLEGISNHPISHVTWDDSIAYCDWLNMKLKASKDTPKIINNLLFDNWKVCLPSEAEWEKSARGSKEGYEATRKFPWGNDFSTDNANLKETGIGKTTTVGSFPNGASHYGLLDMAGNVWEWTRSMWGKEEYLINYPYPYDPQDGREKKQSEGLNSLRTLRGGSFNNYCRYSRCSARRSPLPVLRTSIRGFRIVLTSYNEKLIKN
jgi:formylglycine-generating enzyme required for sulfatase activity